MTMQLLDSFHLSPLTPYGILGHFGEQSIYCDIWPCQFKLALTGTDWQGAWVAEHKGRSWGRAQPSPPLVTMVTAWGNNRCCWHFWLMSRRWRMTAVTHTAHRWQPGKRDDIISVRQILGYDEGKAVCVCVCVFLCVPFLTGRFKDLEIQALDAAKQIVCLFSVTFLGMLNKCFLWVLFGRSSTYLKKLDEHSQTDYRTSIFPI